ncbi:MAG TPA: MlaD family protein [Kofleriaceae bacterium]|nr:MlaD family protein [Kofleriaceae bacterium]
MTSSASTHVRLGLLAIAGFAAVVVALLALGIYGMRTTKSITYHTYFDESVQGLELGAPVKYRGVRIGSIESIEVAPDRKRVDVGLLLLQKEVGRLGLADSVPELRTQLATQGVTGVKFVEIDFFDPATNPLPQLAFPPAARYIPARASIMKGLLDNLEGVGQRLPELVDRAVASLSKFELALDDFRDQRVARQVSDAVASIGGASADLRRLIQHLDRAQIGDRTANLIGNLDTAVARLNSVLARIDGDAGLVASARRAADSIGDVSAGAVGSTTELERTLHQLGDAAQAVRELVEAIERDPDMLVKGRARSRRP